MKKLILVAIFAAITLNSCKKEPEVDSLVLSGQIDNFRKRSITLTGHNFEKRIKFDRKTKTFTDTLIGLKPGHYVLAVGKRPVELYLTPNEDLKIKVDGKKRTKSATFEGENADINNFLAKRRKKYNVLFSQVRKLYGSEEDDFISQMNDFKGTMIDFAEKAQLPPEYLEMEKRIIQYEYVRSLNIYQKYHRIVTDNPDFEVSKDFDTGVDDIDFDNSTDYIQINPFRKLLTEYLKDLSDKKTPEGGDSFMTHLETIQTEITDTLVKNDLIHKVSKSGLAYTSNIKEYYEKYLKFSTSDKNKREVTEMFNKLKLTAAGEPSPTFENYQNYEGGTTSLDDLIGHGKYLYIDLWATWCGFCKKEIPLLKNFEVKYHGKNIEFVSISVDKKKDYEKWRKTIEEKEMGGVQLFAGDTEKNLQFTKDYFVKGLPKFIILDPDGNIVTANAPRPSEGEKLHEIFAELGIEEN